MNELEKQKYIKENEIIPVLGHDDIKSRIYTIRGEQVMLDYNLAELYQVQTKVLNQAVKRNIERFPDRYMFQLTYKEKKELVTNCDQLNKLKHSSINPYVFTEHGVSQSSSILNSKIAIEVSIKIIDAFIAMRRFLANNGNIYNRLTNIEQMQIEHVLKLKDHENNINQLFEILDNSEDIPKQKVYFENQVYDAYELLTKIIKKAKKSIIIIDNYIDDTVFTVLGKRKKGVNVKILTKNFTKQLKLDLEKYNSQYSAIEIKKFKSSHDRFMILDDKEIYCFGASLKDLGKKWFGFFRVEKGLLGMMEKVK